MEVEENYKEVYFGDYCKVCKHSENPESEPPCDECLEYPVNLYSHKPIYYKPKQGQEDYIVPDHHGEVD